MRRITRKMAVLAVAVAAPCGLLAASLSAASAAAHGSAHHGSADHGSADHGSADHGKAHHGKAHHGKAHHGKAHGHHGRGGGGAQASGFAVAPYVDLTNNQEPMLNSAAKAGLKAFTAAFVIADGSTCSPIWGDTLPVTNDPTVTGEIKTAEADGATPIISFGGEAGSELATVCSSVSQLTAVYQSVISTLHVNHIDFDVEGAAIADTNANNMRFQAINQLEAKNPGLVVSVTIPVLPTGPVATGQAFLQAMASNHTHISVVNVMAMDYGGSFDHPANMGTDAVKAAKNTLKFLKTVSSGAGFSMIGVTPMIGQNDDSAEVFSEANAQQLVKFAESVHLGRLAFWSVDRDQPCSGSAQGLPACSMINQQPLAFTKAFDQF